GYDFFNDQDEYVLLDVKDAVENGTDVTVQNINTKETIVAKLSLAPREKVMILQGGLLNAIKELGGDF
ncbi:MAG: aconitate hydratase, partial [Coprobacillus cateniformis]